VSEKEVLRVGRGIRKLAHSEEARVGEFEQGVEIEASTIESRKVAGCSSRDTVKDGLCNRQAYLLLRGAKIDCSLKEPTEVK
jgi:hypothetical protein